MKKKDVMANKVKGMLQIRRILQLLEESRSKHRFELKGESLRKRNIK